MLFLLIICGGMVPVCLGGCKDSVAYSFRPIYTDAGTGGTPVVNPDAGADVAPPPTCPTELVGYATLDGGTTGGGDGPTYTADTLAQLRTYAGMAGPAIIRINGTIAFPTDAGAQPVEVESDKTVIPVHVGDGLVYNGLRVKDVHNVIVRNVTIAKALNGFDGITIQVANNVWVDHCDISSDLTSPKSTYDGLVDIVHGSKNITVSWNRFHDHYSVSLVGHTDSPNPATDGDEDLSLAVTFHHNLYSHIVEGAPRARFGHVHLFNNFYDTVQMASDPTAATYAIASTDGATLLVESNVFDQVVVPMVDFLNDNTSVTNGSINDINNLYGTGSSASANMITVRNTWKPPYPYGPVDLATNVRAVVGMCAGPGNVP